MEKVSKYKNLSLIGILIYSNLFDFLQNIDFLSFSSRPSKYVYYLINPEGTSNNPATALRLIIKNIK